MRRSALFFLALVSGLAGLAGCPPPEPGADAGTLPEDWTEGLDAGESLVPRSLYEDMRRRRLGR